MLTFYGYKLFIALGTQVEAMTQANGPSAQLQD